MILNLLYVLGISLYNCYVLFKYIYIYVTENLYNLRLMHGCETRKNKIEQGMR